MDGFLDLYRSGVLRRRVYDDARIQPLLNDGAIGERIDERFLAAMAAAGFADRSSTLNLPCCKRRRVSPGLPLRNGRIENSEGQSAAASFDTAAARRELLALCTGRQLTGGILLHGCFFSRAARILRGVARSCRIRNGASFRCAGSLSSISSTAAIKHLKIAQRRHGRFLNSTMMVTLLGAAVSDGLADGRVVSGVGGQYNFVAMAHSLPGARSILTLRSTREKNSKLSSNILWNYGTRPFRATCVMSWSPNTASRICAA